MKNEEESIKERLGKLGLGTRREEEIVRELSKHLTDHAAALETRGLSRDSAAREALESVSNWTKLRNEILLAESEETTMNYRTKALWLPALGTFTLSMGLLSLLQVSGFQPRFYWLSKTGMSMQPYLMFYLPWLIVLPLIGAVAAYWSQRAGGKPLHRLLAALAPPIGMLLFIFAIIPLISLLTYMLMPLFLHGGGHHEIHPILHAPPMIAVVAFLVSWVLLPAMGLLLGAVPFLRMQGSHQSSVLSCQ
jgi:hypothetical protein